MFSLCGRKSGIDTSGCLMDSNMFSPL